MSEQAFTVLVVDDDAAIRKLVLLFLKRAGYETIEATNAADARKLLKTVKWDLAVFDRRLPDADGAVLCKEVRSDPEFKAPNYIIMLTAESEQADKIQGLDLGADDYVIKPFQHGELLARIRAGKRIIDLQKQLVEANRKLEILSVTDGLTQLYNHRHFQDELVRAFENATRYERPLSLAIIDLDFFKKVNDTYGHATGDVVLKHVSKIFQESSRASDVAARYGGEEFAVMMPETTLEDALSFAEKIRARIESEPVPTDKGDVPVTVSIGVSTVPHPRIQHPKQLIEDADKSLYRAKKNGRNQVHAERRRRESGGLRRSGDGTAA